MNTKSNDTMLHNIASTDFLFINSKSNSSLKILDLYEINKNIKQLCGLLKFIKNVEDGCVYLFIKNKFLYNITRKFLLNFSSSDKIIVLNSISKIDQKQKLKKNSLVISFNSIYQTNNMIEKFLENNKFLIYNFGLNIKNNHSGVYILKNYLDDYKKLIFLLIILVQILDRN